MMLSIKANLYQLLKTLAITPNIYFGELPQNPKYPATVYDVISDVAIGQTHDAGVHDFRRTRIQIDVFAETVAAAEDAIERYFDELDNFKGLIGDGQSPEALADVSIFDGGANPDQNFEDEPTLKNVQARSRDFMVLY